MRGVIVFLGVGGSHGTHTLTQARTHTHHLVVEGVEHDHRLRGVRHEPHQLHDEEDQHEEPVVPCRVNTKRISYR